MSALYFSFLVVMFSFNGSTEAPKHRSTEAPKHLKLRFRIKEKYHYKRVKWHPNKTAIIVVDMWDKHHCIPSEKRVISLAKKINSLLSFLRNIGVQVIFAPSDMVSYYVNTSNRKRTILLSNMNKVFFKELSWLSNFKEEPSMPVESGCEDNKQNFDGTERSWSHQIDLLEIEENDLISENGSEIINILMNKKIQLILYAGVHSNICIVGRPFGMRNLKKEGFQVILIRDLTDSYSKMDIQLPFQRDRNKAVINHIETYVGSTIHSNQLKPEFKK